MNYFNNNINYKIRILILLFFYNNNYYFINNKPN